jgi:glycerol-3-phosphate dehydrogenase subunit B
MPSADVVVVGAGLAGLACAHGLARRGARVVVIAKGFAALHWTAGTVDVAAPAGASTAREGVARLAAIPGHPYALLADDVAAAVDDLLGIVAARGLPYAGTLDSPIHQAPTGIGATRPVAIVPAAQAGALPAWRDEEQLVVCGIAGFKDFWPAAVAASLVRPALWRLADTDTGPSRVLPVSAALPDIAGRRNLTALHLARAFDQPSWRERAIVAIARAVEAAGAHPPIRVALPAVLGLNDHAAVLGSLRATLGVPVFELPLVPPSVPGLRLYDALRAACRDAGVRVQLGEAVARFEATGDRVDHLITPAAARELSIRTGAVVLATGGLAGGGIVGLPDGGFVETVLGVPVDGPPRDDWLAREAFVAEGHPVERAGIRVDRDLRPVATTGWPVYTNVRVCGAQLSGQRWLRERCGDGVAVASAWRAAASIANDGFTAGSPSPSLADATAALVSAHAPVAEPTR